MELNGATLAEQFMFDPHIQAFRYQVMKKRKKAPSLRKELSWQAKKQKEGSSGACISKMVPCWYKSLKYLKALK